MFAPLKKLQLKLQLELKSLILEGIKIHSFPSDLDLTVPVITFISGCGSCNVMKESVSSLVMYFVFLFCNTAVS